MASMASRRDETPKNAQPGDILLVVHEFVARSPDEISLSKGDRVELIEKDDDFGDGWYLGRHLQTNNTGLFPEVYTTIPSKVNELLGKNFVKTDLAEHYSHATDTTRLIETSSIRSPPPSTPLPDTPKSFSDKGSLENRLGELPVSQPWYETSGKTQDALRRSPQQNSAVMNEMHNVINEHITDLSKPTNVVAVASKADAEINSSINNGYRNFITGQETDEEEEAAHGSLLTGPDVKKWSPIQVAAYLEGVGVEKAHCNLFREEEFTGEVLLELEQSQIFLKEFDLGPIGRRMRTWQKIKALQDGIAQNRSGLSRRASSTTAGTEDLAKPYPGTSGLGFLPPNIPHGSRKNTRLSAPSERSLSQRPDSSTGSAIAAATGTPYSPSHRGAVVGQQSPFNQGWENNVRIDQFGEPSHPISVTHLHTMSSDRARLSKTSLRSSQVSLTMTNEKADLDRGYQSSAELESRRSTHNALRKKIPSTDHKRMSSYGSDTKRSSRNFFWRRSRDGSPPISTLEPTPNPVDGIRIVSDPAQGHTSPTVTKLEYSEETKPRTQRAPSSKATTFDEFKTAKKTDAKEQSGSRRGLRAISDAVTGRERALLAQPKDKILSNEINLVQSPVDGIADSVEDAAKLQSSMHTQRPTPTGTRRRAKQRTSAYTQGLEKKSPKEQQLGSDYSGWMKKKSSNLMTTWKPRFFILKGCRLSYYYSENDAEEKGLIDISNHRVLPADNDLITGIHATLTGVNSSSTLNDTLMQTGSIGSSTISQPIISMPGDADVIDDTRNQIFIFKLVPPRTGLSKGVNFTKPSVHYFALPSRAEGRLWMGALMKATIDRDESIKVVTTYQQKTISLEQARARRELPPFLRGVGEEERDIIQPDIALRQDPYISGAPLSTILDNDSGPRSELRSPLRSMEESPISTNVSEFKVDSNASRSHDDDFTRVVSNSDSSGRTQPLNAGAASPDLVVSHTRRGSQGARSSQSRRRESHTRKSRSRMGSHDRRSSALGAGAVASNEPESPILERMKSAGLW